MAAPDGFERFAECHVGDLLRLARALCETQQEAEDLTQDTLVRTMQKWALVRAADDPLAYARRILVNEHHSRHRRRRLRVVPIDEVAEVAAGDPTEHSDTGLWILAALKKLTVRQRTVVVLRYYLQLTDREIAAWTGLRRSSVRASLSRATAVLRSHLDNPTPTDKNLPDKGA